MQDFMNGVCTNILHMQQKKITTYAGNYDTYVTARAQMEEQQMKKYNWEQDQVCCICSPSPV
jgi:ATP-binding cassette, subfamily F, member 2